MKKTILAVLLVAMVATPCFAQEVEPEGLFSLHGTKWQALPIGMSIFPLPWIWTTDGLQFGFDDGQVYLSELELVNNCSSYIDMLVVSVFSSPKYCTSSSIQPLAIGTSTSYFGILQPIGIGMVVEYVSGPTPIQLPSISIALLTKTDDNWTPPEVESEVE